MLAEFLTSSLLGGWLVKSGVLKLPPAPGGTFPTVVLQPLDSHRDQIIKAYLNQLAQKGVEPSQQGLWIQTNRELLTNHQGQQLRTPASLTKIATTLALIQTFGPHHIFQTKYFATGPIANGVLTGDLIVQAEGDPLLLTPELITIGNQLNQRGIHQVTGDLVLQGPVSVNFSQDVSTAGALMKQIWQSSAWTDEIQQTYAAMKKGTLKPTLTIGGNVSDQTSMGGTLLLSHGSLPLADLLKFMNIYSNNFMAEWFAKLIGGAEKVQAIAIESDRVAPSEIKLMNGSGLGQDNKLSPRAVVGLLQAIQTKLQPFGLTIGDVFPVAGQDQGALEERNLPKATVVKTGTLWNTSGLAGILKTQDQGTVWFAIMNQGDSFTEGFRQGQDQLLQQLSRKWGVLATAPGTTTATVSVSNSADQQRHRDINRFMQLDFLSH